MAIKVGKYSSCCISAGHLARTARYRHNTEKTLSVGFPWIHISMVSLEISPVNKYVSSPTDCPLGNSPSDHMYILHHRHSTIKEKALRMRVQKGKAQHLCDLDRDRVDATVAIPRDAHSSRIRNNLPFLERHVMALAMVVGSVSSMNYPGHDGGGVVAS